jgi:hypothetical protein
LPSSATTTTSSSSSEDSSREQATTLQIPPALLEALVSAQQQHALLECLSWPVSESLAVQLAPALLCPVQAPNGRWGWLLGVFARCLARAHVFNTWYTCM